MILLLHQRSSIGYFTGSLKIEVLVDRLARGERQPVGFGEKLGMYLSSGDTPHVRGWIYGFINLDVGQLGRSPGPEPGGRRSKSCHPDQNLAE